MPRAQRLSRDLSAAIGKFTTAGSYATGGWSFDMTARITDPKSVIVENNGGYVFNYDFTNKKLKCYTPGVKAASFTGTAIAASSLLVTDDNDAASKGVAIYLHTRDGVTGWLEFVSPTNTDGLLTISDGGAKVVVFDSNAAATDGFAITCDEDATDGARLLAICPSLTTIYVPVVGGGGMIPITYAADPTSAGVAIYLDEDGTETFERVMFVSPTNADATNANSTTYKSQAVVSAGACSGGTAGAADERTEVATVLTDVYFTVIGIK
jgi:hypothetical protein